jgi:CRISPR-associated protein Csb2
MPLSISIRFLTGRAHLHHWHAHHSDGKVDWPPSPWRLLRALVAAAGTGLTSLPEPLDETIADTEGDALQVSRLARVLAMLAESPRIWLPRTGGGHTRQFLPKEFKSTGSAVFDSFATVSKDTPIVFEWPELELAAADERFTDLQTMLRRLTYFGRAESWCDATVQSGLPSEIKPEQTHWCCQALAPDVKPSGKEHVDYTLERKLAAEMPLDSQLREQALAIFPACEFKVFEVKTAKDGKVSEKWKKPTEAQLESFKTTLSAEPIGVSLLRCLLRSSGEDIKSGLERPIGSRWIHYTVPRAIYQLPASAPRRAAQAKPDGPLITLMRFALNTATVNRPVLPSITDTLLVADKFRAAALAWHGHLFDRTTGVRPRNLRGREDDNSTVQSGHDHAYFWPTDGDADGFIDHVSVFCPSGLSTDEIEALRRLIRLKQRGGRPDLLVTPVYEGNADEFPAWKGKTAITFVSATPYFPNVHITRGLERSPHRLKLVKVVRNSLELSGYPSGLAEVHQIIATGNVRQDLLHDCEAFSGSGYSNRSLWSGDFELPVGADFLMEIGSQQKAYRPMDYCRRRKNVIIKSTGRYLQIKFDQPVPAQPFAIGHSSHFGLGLFVPVDHV